MEKKTVRIIFREERHNNLSFTLNFPTFLSEWMNEGDTWHWHHLGQFEVKLMAADDSEEILLPIYREIVARSENHGQQLSSFHLFHLLLWINSLRENRDDPITTKNASISFWSGQKPKVYENSEWKSIDPVVSLWNSIFSFPAWIMQRHQLFHFFSFTLLPLKSEAAGTKHSINLLPVVLVTDIVTVCLQKQTLPISQNNNTDPAQTVWGDYYCVKTPSVLSRQNSQSP